MAESYAGLEEKEVYVQMESWHQFWPETVLDLNRI